MPFYRFDDSKDVHVFKDDNTAIEELEMSCCDRSNEAEKAATEALREITEKQFDGGTLILWKQDEHGQWLVISHRTYDVFNSPS